MQRRRIIWTLAAWATGCADATAPATDGAGSSGGEVCEPGYDGCPCVIATCLGALECVDDICVVPSETQAPTESGDDDDTAPASSSDALEGSTSTGMLDDASSSSGSSTTEVEAECVDDDVSCLAGELRTCDDQQWTTTTCAEHCALSGFGTDGCENENECRCAGFIDMTCSDGVFGLCQCQYELAGSDCSGNDISAYYADCIEMTDPTFACFAPYFVDGQIDCDVAAAACL